MTVQTGSIDGLLLRGLDGSNPLGFLAALGTLRTLSLAWPDRNVRMKWVENGGAYRPAVTAIEQLGSDQVVAAVFDVACHGESDVNRDQARRHRDEFLKVQRQIDDQEAELEKRKLKKKVREEHLAPLRERQTRHRTAWLKIAHPYLLLGPDTTVPPAQCSAFRRRFRQFEEESVATSCASRRNYADFVAALGTSASSQDDDRIADTALRTMSGAGHQHFLGFMVNLLLAVTPDHLRRALFETWTYDDPVQNLTMRWDPIDDARYALQWSDPSGDPTRTTRGSVLGANVLALVGLPMICSITAEAGLRTVGFTGRRASDTFWTWPIWHPWIDANTCCSLLAHPVVANLHRNQDAAGRDARRAELAALGVTTCFRSRRITVNKVRSFTPAEAV